MEITARDSPFSFDLILPRHTRYMIPVGNYEKELEMRMPVLKFFYSFNLYYVFIDGKRYIFVFLTENKYGLIASNLYK